MYRPINSAPSTIGISREEPSFHMKSAINTGSFFEFEDYQEEIDLCLAAAAQEDDSFEKCARYSYLF